MKQKYDICHLLAKVEFVAFDFDGVFTDNRVFISEEGKESVICNRSDGIGLDLLKKMDIYSCIISSEINPLVSKRAKKLKIDCFQSCENKFLKLNQLLDQKKLTPANAAFLGNDINDLECLSAVGISAVVNDAYESVRNVADIVLTKCGGHGAVREFCEMIASNRSAAI